MRILLLAAACLVSAGCTTVKYVYVDDVAETRSVSALNEVTGATGYADPAFAPRDVAENYRTPNTTQPPVRIPDEEWPRPQLRKEKDED